MTPSPEYVIPDPPEWFSKIYTVPKDYCIEWKKNGAAESTWKANPGPQTWALLCPHDEILIGGRRGGSKSETLKAWFAMGDWFLPETDPCHWSFLNEPSYRGLILREQYQDLEEFIDECEEFYRPFGGKPTGKPRMIQFPNPSKRGEGGARLYFRHLGDKEAYNQARGWGLTRIGIEELTQIPEEDWYLSLHGSLRNKRQFRVVNGKRCPALRTQIMSTTNPDGPGGPWVKARFVKVPRMGGGYCEWNSPMYDKITGLKRIFIPMKLEDNPYLRDDKVYKGRLLGQNEVKRKQWMEGDWEAGVGTFFLEYRPDGPVDDEKIQTPWAKHKTPPVELQPWWFRFGSGDLGYDHPSVLHKFVRNESDKRLHVYDELVLRQTAAYELGVLVAKWWLPELENLPDHQITIFLSPDAFAKRDVARSLAEQMANGIQEILGPYGALLLRFTDEERLAAQKNPKLAEVMFARRRQDASGRMCITLKSANNDVEAGCSAIRELLRFRPIITETQEEIKSRLMKVFESRGVEAYEKELSKTHISGPEVLPKILIWEKCRGLDRCLKAAVHDDPPNNERYRKWDAQNGVGGDDPLDSCFVAGTLVKTRAGDVPIEEIQAGDYVWTRSGLREVISAGRTGDRPKPVLLLRLSNGRTLTGTGNHPIFVVGRGFSRLDSLRYGDMVETWQKPLFLTESNSADTQSLSEGTYDVTTGPEEIIENEELVLCIRKSGGRFMEKSPLDTTSTILMETRSITPRKTWRLNPNVNTSETTGWSPRIGKSFDGSSLWGKNSQSYGINPLKEENGIQSTVKRCSSNGWFQNAFVKNAGGSIRPNFLHALDSADQIANSGLGGRLARIMWRLLAYVGWSSLRTSTMAGYSAPVRVLDVRPLGAAFVYNLAVSQDPEYYANEILVHNCRYGIMGWKEIKTTIPKSYWVADRMVKLAEEHSEAFGSEITDINRIIQIQRTQSGLYEKQFSSGGGGITLPRSSSMRHRVQ